MSDLYQLGRRLTEIALEDMGAGELGLAAGEFLVLQDLYLNGRSPVGDIAKRTGLAQSRVSTIVRALVGRGWVTTATDPTDGRKTLVDLTEDVRTAGAKRRAGRADKTLTAALVSADDDERATLIAALARLHQLLVADQPPDASQAPPVAHLDRTAYEAQARRSSSGQRTALSGDDAASHE